MSDRCPSRSPWSVIAAVAASWLFPGLVLAEAPPPPQAPADHTPPGWQRDERGQLFQVNFDLNRRFWLGSQWLFAAGDTDVDGVELDVGLRGDAVSWDARKRYRFHGLLGSLTLDPLTLRATLFRADASYDHEEPILRITTFFGAPKRHDLFLAIGWWGDLLTVEHHPRGSAPETQLRVVGGGPTWDLWQDADLTSFVRLRAGANLEHHFVRSSGGYSAWALAPLAYLEADITFDRGGFHHLLFASGFEGVFVLDGTPELQKRFVNEVGYEVIVLAINDQPVTLRAVVGGGYREDLAVGPSGWEVTARVGLRTSLWAPARDLEALDAAEQRRARR